MTAVRTHVVLAGLLALSLATGAAAAESENVNVSRLPELQTGATIAIDPSDSETLLAGSNSIEEGTMRIYSSTDGGRSWTTVRAHPPPAKPLASCSSDPGVAIDARGRQYYSFVRATPCRDGARQYVYVVVRTGPGGDVVEADPRRRARDEPGSTTSLPSRSTTRREPASGTGVPRVDAHCPQCRVQHRPEPFRQRRADLVEARQGPDRGAC